MSHPAGRSDYETQQLEALGIKTGSTRQRRIPVSNFTYAEIFLWFIFFGIFTKMAVTVSAISRSLKKLPLPHSEESSTTEEMTPNFSTIQKKSFGVLPTAETKTTSLIWRLKLTISRMLPILYLPFKGKYGRVSLFNVASGQTGTEKKPNERRRWFFLLFWNKRESLRVPRLWEQSSISGGVRRGGVVGGTGD